MSTSVLVYLVPGTWHSPGSYSKLMDALNEKIYRIYRRVEGIYEIRVQCIDYERLLYLKAGKVPTMNSYVEKCENAIKKDYDSVGKDCKIFIVSHSMGSPISQMVISNLVKSKHVNPDSICGMVHIAGNLVRNHSNIQPLSNAQSEILSRNDEVDPIEMELIGDDWEWMRVQSTKSVQQYFLNDSQSAADVQKLHRSLEPEITSFMEFPVVYDEKIVDKTSHCYVQTLRDNYIDIELQRKMCAEFGIRDQNVIVMDTGHDPAITKPLELSRHICKWMTRTLRAAKI